MQIPFIYIPRKIFDYEQLRLLHLDASDWNGSGQVTDKLGTVFYNTNVTKTSNSFYFNSSAYLISTGLDSDITEFPIYFALFNTSNWGQIVGKNSYQGSGYNSSGRYLFLSAVGDYHQNDTGGQYTALPDPLSFNTWNLICYARFSNVSSQQRKRHFRNTIDSTIYNQPSLSYTSNTDQFLIGSGFIGRVEAINGYIKEIILYNGTGLSDIQRSELIDSKFNELKTKWGI